MTEKNLKKGSTSFIIRKMQFKTTLRFSIIIARMTKTIIQIATHEKGNPSISINVRVENGD